MVVRTIIHFNFSFFIILKQVFVLLSGTSVITMFSYPVRLLVVKVVTMENWLMVVSLSVFKWWSLLYQMFGVFLPTPCEY